MTQYHTSRRSSNVSRAGRKRQQEDQILLNWSYTRWKPTMRLESGDKIGISTIIREIEPQWYNNGNRRKKKLRVFFLECECGSEFIRNDICIRNSRHNACRKCAHRICAEKNKTNPVLLSRQRTDEERLFVMCRSSAKKRNMTFGICLSFFSLLIKKPCHYCGGQPSIRTIASEFQKQKRAARKTIANGIDRIDSSIGYIESNCVPCCWKRNLAKGKFTVDEFLEHCKKIVEFTKLKQVE